MSSTTYNVNLTYVCVSVATNDCGSSLKLYTRSQDAISVNMNTHYDSSLTGGSFLYRVTGY